MHNFPTGWRFAAPAHPLSFRSVGLTQARRLVTRSGKRSRGRFPSAKAPVAQCYESQLELHAFRLLELAPSVSAFTAQPAQMVFQGVPELRYTPDLAVVMECGSQHLVEVKPARMLLTLKVLDRMSEVVRRYRERGYDLRFLLDIDIVPTSVQAQLLRDALHWTATPRIAPQPGWIEPGDPLDEDESQPAAPVTPPERFGSAQVGMIRSDCDAILATALCRSFEETVAAARAAQWTAVQA